MRWYESIRSCDGITEITVAVSRLRAAAVSFLFPSTLALCDISCRFTVSIKWFSATPGAERDRLWSPLPVTAFGGREASDVGGPSSIHFVHVHSLHFLSCKSRRPHIQHPRWVRSNAEYLLKNAGQFKTCVSETQKIGYVPVYII